MSIKKIFSEKKISRRGFLVSSTYLISALTIFPSFTKASSIGDSVEIKNLYSFEPVKEGNPEELELAYQFEHNVLIGWGDELFNLSDEDKKDLAVLQEKSFGYNNDFIAFFPLDEKNQSGLLFVNHEYPDQELMYNNVNRDIDSVRYEMASLGASIVEIRNKNGKWEYIKNSKYNRRISALSTEIEISGPAAGHKRLQTKTDKSGKKVIGTFANCSGGKTPWKTALSCEENFDDYFSGRVAKEFDEESDTTKIIGEYVNHRTIGIKFRSKYGWSDYFDRFNISSDPNEPNKFGWVVEIDPFNSEKPIKKRTALGRFKHESATVALGKDNKVSVYMADDEAFQFIYKFVSEKPYNSNDIDYDILDSGILYCAKFDDDGTLEWLPLIFGKNVLDKNSGFDSQADVLIETRKAARLMKATELDRPEDIEVNPFTNKVYVSLTGNAKRVAANAPNPRMVNIYGHIIEITPENEDHSSLKATWQIYRLGDDEDHNFANPDNLAISPKGELWVATDGMPKSRNVADGFFLVDKNHNLRMLNAPKGAEVTGPEFTKDGKTLFLSIQHPAEGSSYSSPETKWPDFKENTPPRPAVIAITRKTGDMI